jgi:hypothetical protein
MIGGATTLSANPSSTLHLILAEVRDCAKSRTTPCLTIPHPPAAVRDDV